MYDLIDLPRTPAMARRVIEYSDVNGSSVPPALRTLAETDVITADELDQLPITASNAQERVLQYLKDRDGKAVVVTSQETITRATVINYIALEKFERVLIGVDESEISSFKEQLNHFLGHAYTIGTFANKQAPWPENATMILVAGSAMDHERVLDFNPRWAAFVQRVNALPLEALALEWPSAAMFMQISPKLVKGTTPEETVTTPNWNQGGIMDTAVDFVTGSRLLRAMRSYTVFTTKFKDRKVPESGYSDWLRVAGVNCDLIPEKAYTHRIWREKYMQVPTRTPYGKIDDERADAIRNNQARPQREEQDAWKQLKAIEEFERTANGELYDVLSNWVLNNTLPSSAPVDDVIEAYQNLRRGNWVRDKVSPLVHPIITLKERTIIIANSKPVQQELRHTMGCNQILDGKLAQTDTRVQTTLANFRDSKPANNRLNARGGGSTAHILVINFEYAEQTEVLKLADTVYWLEYPTNYLQFESIRSAAEKVSVPLIMTHLKGTWEDALLSVLLERDLTS